MRDARARARLAAIEALQKGHETFEFNGEDFPMKYHPFSDSTSKTYQQSRLDYVVTTEDWAAVAQPTQVATSFER